MNSDPSDQILGGGFSLVHERRSSFNADHITAHSSGKKQALTIIELSLIIERNYLQRILIFVHLNMFLHVGHLLLKVCGNLIVHLKGIARVAFWPIKESISSALPINRT